MANSAGKIGGFMLITKSSKLKSNHVTFGLNHVDFTGGNLAIVNNSVADMRHTSITVMNPSGNCPFTITGGSDLKLASIYSTDKDSNNTLVLGSHEVCVDSTSQALGIETGF